MKITIDGPAGSGKSTIAKLLAKELGLNYLDTGAMYRAITYFALINEIDLKRNKDELSKALSDITLKFEKNKIYLNEKDVSDEIRTPEVSHNVSEVSALDFVRADLTKQQQRIAEETDIIMDGRDTGTTVLPNADFKFYLDASPECRAKRRMLEMNPNETKYNEVLDEIKRRDYIDSHREISPLTKPDDAFYLNTDNYSIEEVLEILKKVITNDDHL